jgi:hypothetical protein
VARGRVRPHHDNGCGKNVRDTRPIRKRRTDGHIPFQQSVIARSFLRILHAGFSKTKKPMCQTFRRVSLFNHRPYVGRRCRIQYGFRCDKWEPTVLPTLHAGSAEHCTHETTTRKGTSIYGVNPPSAGFLSVSFRGPTTTACSKSPRPVIHRTFFSVARTRERERERERERRAPRAQHRDDDEDRRNRRCWQRRRHPRNGGGAGRERPLLLRRPLPRPPILARPGPGFWTTTSLPESSPPRP